MTQIDLVKSASRLSLTASGHAGFASEGKDIVCAAVTILIRTAMQLLSEQSGVDFKSDTSSRGNISFAASVAESDSLLRERLSCTGDFLAKGFESLAREFPDNIKFGYNLEDKYGKN